MIELLEAVAVQSPGFLILALATGAVASEDIACVAAGGCWRHGVFLPFQLRVQDVC